VRRRHSRVDGKDTHANYPPDTTASPHRRQLAANAQRGFRPPLGPSWSRSTQTNRIFASSPAAHRWLRALVTASVNGSADDRGRQIVEDGRRATRLNLRVTLLLQPRTAPIQMIQAAASLLFTA